MSKGVVEYSRDITRSALALPVDARREMAQTLLWSLPRDEVLALNARLCTMLQKDIIGLLPPELAFIILAKLDLEDLLRCALVSRTWAKLCNEQALWALLCASHVPPIRPAETSWADITRHKQLMYATQPTSSSTMTASYEDHDDGGMFDDDRERERDRFGSALEEGEMDVLTSQGGLGGGGGLDPLGMTGGLRRSVWERGGAGSGAGLPTHLLRSPASASASASSGVPTTMPEPIVSSHLPIPSAKPQANYKHLYIVHDILIKRMTTPRPSNLATAGYGSTMSTSTSTTRTKMSASAGMRPSPAAPLPLPLPRPRTIDAISSVTAGGLPGHSEAVYSLSLIHDLMRITMVLSCPDCHVQSALTSPGSNDGQDPEGRNQIFDSYTTGPTTPLISSRNVFGLGRSRSAGIPTSGPNGQPRTDTIVQGRDWLLSGSRDKTLRLWHIATAEPRVVKIFSGGHTGSVLTHCAVKVGVRARDREIVPLSLSSVSSSSRSPGWNPFPPEDNGNGAERVKVKVMAVSGGSDGKICLWDVEDGDGSPAKIVDAHTDSVLCVRGDDERVVSCSKDKTIKLFDVHTLEVLLVIGGNDDPDNHRAAVNAVGLSKEFIVSASGDKTIRLWDIHTGALLTCLEAHSRGIASIDFSPVVASVSETIKRHKEGGRSAADVFKGTIVTGSSDASMKMFEVVQVPTAATLRRRTKHHSDRRGAQSDGHIHEEGGGDDYNDLSFREMLDMDTDMTDLDINADNIADASVSSLSRDPIADEADADADAQEGHTRLIIRQLAKNWASCVCPPGLTRSDDLHCGRCFNRGHVDLVRSVFLGQGYMLSGSYDSSVKIWHRPTARLIADLTGPQRGRGRIFSVVGDRTRVISSGLDCRINIWDFSGGLDTSFVEP